MNTSRGQIKGAYDAHTKERARISVEDAIARVLPGRFPDPDYPDDPTSVHPRAKSLLACEALHTIAKQSIKNGIYGEKVVGTLAEILLFLNSSKALSGSQLRAYTELDWEARKRDAVQLLRTAADRLTDPILGTDALNLSRLLDVSPHDPARANMNFDPPGRLDRRENIEWWAEHDLLPELLKRFASGLEQTPANKLRSLGAHGAEGLERRHKISSHAARKGGGTDDEKADRAFLVRELSRRLPKQTPKPHLVICELLWLIGIRAVPNQVNALLHKRQIQL